MTAWTEEHPTGRSLHPAAAVVFATLLGCSSATSSALGNSGQSVDGGAGDGAVDAPPGFQMAPHPSVTGGLVPKGSGPILAHMKLVTVTFAGYEHEADVQAFGSWLPGSTWLTTVGGEYGVGAGTSAGSVVLQETAPSTVTLPDVGAFVAARVMNGTLPASLANDADYLYVVYYPATTAVHIVASDAGCLAAGGFHASYARNGLYFTYAAIPDDCASLFPGLGLDPLSFVEFDASHEIVEAASDPYTVATDGTNVVSGPSAWRITDTSNPWSAFGGEIGDACTSRCVRESGFTVQRIWSNQAASQGQDPCVPAVAPYFGTSPTGSGVVTVSAGSSAQVPLVGWSAAPGITWKLLPDTGPYITSQFVPGAQSQPASLSNGTTGTLTVSAVAGTPSGSRGIVFLSSSPSPTPAALAYANRTLWPVMVEVP
ncbi:MAG TPA: hypothetical protein VF765_31880 [Polyangiaceae bacterium]